MGTSNRRLTTSVQFRIPLRCLVEGYTEIMKTDPSHLLSQALKLPDDERAALAAELIASLDGDPDEGVEEAWAAEIKRRVDQIERGAVELIPWEQVRAELRQRLDERSSA